uniref:Uncharacterized protein n=1 Tax=Anopheles farauti TaxID=69004 RepID=A0A182Q4L7_9DIPT
MAARLIPTTGTAAGIGRIPTIPNPYCSSTSSTTRSTSDHTAAPSSPPIEADDAAPSPKKLSSSVPQDRRSERLPTPPATRFDAPPPPPQPPPPPPPPPPLAPPAFPAAWADFFDLLLRSVTAGSVSCALAFSTWLWRVFSSSTFFRLQLLSSSSELLFFILAARSRFFSFFRFDFSSPPFSPTLMMLLPSVADVPEPEPLALLGPMAIISISSTPES